MISIIMSAYNEKEEEIRAALDSMLNQTFKKFELILVVDNPSNKMIIKVAHEYKEKDNRLVIILNEKNLGLASSLNKAISIAKFPVIARMDADDYSYTNRLEVELSAIKRGADMVCSKFRVVDGDKKFLKESLSLPKTSKKMRQILKFKNIISHPTVMIRKRVLEEANGYSDLKIIEDYELWYRLSLMNIDIVGINEVLLDYTVRDDSMTTSNYYFGHMAEKYVKAEIKKNTIKKVNNDNYEKWYGQNKKWEEHYNNYAKKYYTLINKWPQYGFSKYFSLIHIILIEPRISKIFLSTIITNILRKS